MRPRFEEIFMRLATDLAKRATCQRLQVGCVITSEDFTTVYSIGYNGNAHGFPNQCDQDTPQLCGCIHGECNAIIKCSAPRDAPKRAFVTHSPCIMCAKMLVNLGGVRTVYYQEEYRLKSGIELLTTAGIEVKMLAPPEEARSAGLE